MVSEKDKDRRLCIMPAELQTNTTSPAMLPLADSAAPESLHSDLPSYPSCVLFWQGRVNRTCRCRVCSLPREGMSRRKEGAGLSFTYSQNSMTGEVAFSLVMLRVEFAFWSSTQFPVGEARGERERKQQRLGYQRI